MRPQQSVREHWPEYLMEGWGLRIFMVAASVTVVILESPDSPLHELISNSDLRRAIIGLATGLTAVGIIYSLWGRRSGVHVRKTGPSR